MRTKVVLPLFETDTLGGNMWDLIKLLAIMLKIIHLENMWLMKSIIHKDRWKSLDETYEKNFDEYFEKLMNYGNNEVDDGK